MGERTCTVDGCNRKHRARGLCQAHYHRWWKKRRASDPNAPRCTIDGCETHVDQHGWCNRHFQRWKTTGDPLGSKQRKVRRCRVETCERPHYCMGYCSRHYHRVQMWGTPVGRIEPTRVERIWMKIERQPNGCWLWVGSSYNGYGRLTVRGSRGPDIHGVHLAHRYVYELLVEPIPEGLELDHRCRITLCVNPAHLEPVTQSENQLRGVRARGLPRGLRS